jgi:hypothetical protein
MHISGSARRLPRSSVQPGGQGIGALAAAERIGASVHPAIGALDREGQRSASLLFPAQADAFPVRAKTFPVRIEQGIWVQHAEIAA